MDYDHMYLGVTIDQLIAQKYGQDTLLSSIQLGIEDASHNSGNCNWGYSCAYTNSISWLNPTTPLPTEVNPRIAFERMFGDGLSAEERRAGAMALALGWDEEKKEYIEPPPTTQCCACGGGEKKIADPITMSFKLTGKIKDEICANVNDAAMEMEVRKSIADFLEVNSDECCIPGVFPDKDADCPENPDKCPVYQLHQVYTDKPTHDWVQEGCRSAGIEDEVAPVGAGGLPPTFSRRSA